MTGRGYYPSCLRRGEKGGGGTLHWFHINANLCRVGGLQCAFLLDSVIDVATQQSGTGSENVTPGPSGTNITQEATTTLQNKNTGGACRAFKASGSDQQVRRKRSRAEGLKHNLFVSHLKAVYTKNLLCTFNQTWTSRSRRASTRNLLSLLFKRAFKISTNQLKQAGLTGAISNFSTIVWSFHKIWI